VRKVCQACGTKLAVVKMAATEPTQSIRFMVCGYVVGALAWLQIIREQRKGLAHTVSTADHLDNNKTESKG
jgi:hypothetical protein